MSPYLGETVHETDTAAISMDPSGQLPSEVDSIVGTVLDCYATLSKISSLQPSPAVNQAFGKLVSTCIQIPDEVVIRRVLADKRVEKILSHLQHLCSVGEGYLEAHWAERITSDKLALIDFPYYTNYVDLTRLELNAIASSCPFNSPTKFAFLGSGPLPMTSFCILAQLQNSATGSDTADISILNIDRDRAAFTLSSELSNHLNYSKAEMNFSCDDAETAEDSLADCDVVYLAALVGSTAKEKRGIVRSIAKRMREGALLVVRSAWGLRTLLYPAIEISDLEAEGLEVMTVVHPRDHVVNSVIVGRIIGSSDGNSVGNSDSSEIIDSNDSSESEGGI